MTGVRRNPLRGASLVVLLGLAIAAPEISFAQQSTPPPETPTFRTEARQVILAISVWKKGADFTCYPYPQTDEDIRKCFPTDLTSSIFHVSENGMAQKINYFAEVDPRFYAQDFHGEDFFSTSTTRGMWWTILPPIAFAASPVSTYIVGYVPPALQAGECRTISASADGYSVLLHRDRYCSSNDSDTLDPATLEGTALGSQMRDFARSGKPGTMKVSAEVFVFRSAGVVSFENDPATESLHASAPFKFKVEVRDPKAPARVYIATAFGPARTEQLWTWSDCEKHHAALHVFGAIYTTDGELAAQFAATHTCMSGLKSIPELFHDKGPGEGVPNRFDTQVELPAGDYKLRVVVSDYRGHFGRSELPIHVPRFDGQRLTVSDVSLSRLVRNKTEIAKDAAEITPAPLVPAPLVSKTLQYLPASGIRLNKHDPAFLYFEIYEPLLEKDQTALQFRMKITDQKTGDLVMHDPPMRAGEWVIPGNVVVPVGVKFTAGSKLKKGSYRLQVQALDDAGQQSEWESVNFSIR